MSTRNSTRIILIATLAAFTVAAAAQNQTNQTQTQQPQPQQQQPQQQQQQQPQQQQQQQPQQPQPKKSVWQKLRDANTAIQGPGTTQGTTQQGGAVQQQAGQVQQTGQQVQQGVQGVQQQLPANGSQANQGGSAGSCGPSCFDAGPFQANVSQMTMSQEGPWHILRMNIVFHNSTNQPLVIAYHDGSMVMVDNNGNTYIPAGGNPGQLQGMGIDRGNQTDSQFVIAPGQTGSALFSVARNRAQNSPVGTGYTYNLTIDELQTQNGAMAIPVRTYNLNFPTLAPGTSNAAFSSGPSSNGFAGGGNGTAAYGNTQTGQSVGVPAQQQGVKGAPGPGMVNAAMKTPVTTTTTKTSAATAAAKPIPATTATKPTTTTAPKKTPPTTTTTAK